MTLSILDLNGIFNNKSGYSICSSCGCVYNTAECLCIRMHELNRYFGREYLDEAIRYAGDDAPEMECVSSDEPVIGCDTTVGGRICSAYTRNPWMNDTLL